MIVGESGKNPVCKHHRIQIVWRIGGLTLDGTAEPVLRDLLIYSQERAGTGSTSFSFVVQLTTSRIGNHND